MGAKPTCPLPAAEMESIKAETGINEENIVELWHRFKKLDRNERGTLGRDDFLAIPDFMLNPLADRITHLFFPKIDDDDVVEEGSGGGDDKGDGAEDENANVPTDGVGDGGGDKNRVDFRQFVRTMAIFRPLSENQVRDSDAGADFINSKKEKLRFAFRMYDIDGNGEIQETEIMEVLQMMLDLNIDKRHLVNIAKRTLAEADKDGDAMITFEEFYRTLHHTDIEKSLSLRYFM